MSRQDRERGAPARRGAEFLLRIGKITDEGADAPRCGADDGRNMRGLRNRGHLPALWADIQQARALTAQGPAHSCP